MGRLLPEMPFFAESCSSRECPSSVAPCIALSSARAVCPSLNSANAKPLGTTLPSGRLPVTSRIVRRSPPVFWAALAQKVCNVSAVVSNDKFLMNRVAESAASSTAALSAIMLAAGWAAASPAGCAAAGAGLAANASLGAYSRYRGTCWNRLNASPLKAARAACTFTKRGRSGQETSCDSYSPLQTHGRLCYLALGHCTATSGLCQRMVRLLPGIGMVDAHLLVRQLHERQRTSAR